MKNYEIQSLLMKALPLQEVQVSGDGRHFQIIAVGKIFDGMSRVKKQKIIYEPLTEYISTGRIHSLSVKIYTPQEWESNRKLNNFFY